jgi:hypothetical protein
VDELVYEMHPGSTLTGEAESFHFVLSDGRYKDNRIPPQGFNIDGAAERLAVPVWHGVEDPAYFTPEEYNGGYDDVALTIPGGADSVEVNLYYQTTSREYIEFLRDEINGTADTLTGTGAGGDPPYIAQSDPFFSGLGAWGDTIWQLWTHNMNVDGAAPFLMTQATIGGGGGGCSVAVPTLTSATAGNQQVTLAWTDSANVNGYRLYYDQASKAQLVSDVTSTSYTDSGLTNGQEYCYKVTSYDATCESGYSNILCATPQNQGQTTDPAGVVAMETGLWDGKGKNQQFVTTGTFAVGDEVVVRARVLDVSGNPVSNATVQVTIGGPESVTLNSNPSDADGWAEATWQTQSPNRKGQGGTTTGTYTASTTDVTASGYHWDGVTTQTSFTLQ